MRSGKYPDDPNGNPGNPPPRASRFRTPEAEAEALGRGQRQLETDLANGTVKAPIDPVTGRPQYVDPGTGNPVRHRFTVTTNHPDGFGGTSYVPQRNASGQPILDAAGNRIPVADPSPLNKARIIYEYVPSANEWRPVTYYPEP